jgi:ferredoxin
VSDIVGAPLPGDESDEVTVWIDQDECTGDGLCVVEAPTVFEFDIDGLAYVKDAQGVLQQARGAAVQVAQELLDIVVGAAEECPGTCIYVRRASGEVLAGPS